MDRETVSGCVPSTTTIVFRIPSLTTARYIALRGSKPPSSHKHYSTHLRKHNACFACRNSRAAFLGASLSPGCSARILLGWYRSHGAYTGGTERITISLTQVLNPFLLPYADTPTLAIDRYLFFKWALSITNDPLCLFRANSILSLLPFYTQLVRK